MSQNTRWSFEATIDPNDKPRLRGFVRNEITYYNGLLDGFSSRLRTAPEIFGEVEEGLVGEVAAHSYNLRSFSPDTLPESLLRFKNRIFDGANLIVPERTLMLLDVISSPVVLHPEAKRAIAVEVLRAHIQQAEALRRTSNKFDQVLQGPVVLLHPTEARIKRHVQLPKSAVRFNEDRTTIKTAYHSVPIKFRGTLPVAANWNLLIIRDDERPGHHKEGGWAVEFRQEKADFLPRLSDTPFQKKADRRQIKKETGPARVLGMTRR